MRTMEEAGVVVHVRMPTTEFLLLAFMMRLFFQDWPYPDGDPPPDQIIDSWLSLIHSTFAGDQSKSKIARVLSKATSSNKSTAANGIIGIHCIAGLGRLF